MKKFIITLAILGMSASAVTPALAQETSYIGQVTMKEFIGNSTTPPAILVTNLFYSGKKFFSGVQGFFTPSANKVPFYLQVMDAKASETLKLIEIAPDNVSAVISALKEYQVSVIQLQSSFKRFLNSQNAITSWQSISDQLLRHLNFTDDMLTTVSNNTGRALLIDAQDSLREGMVNLLARPGRAQTWIKEVTTAEPGFAFSDLRAAEQLRNLAVTAEQLREDFAAVMFSDASAELMQTIATRMNEQLDSGDELVISDLSRVSGAPAERLLSIENLIELEPALGDNEELNNLIAKLTPQ